MTNFDIAFNYLIHEDESSKYVDDPNDSGGPTRWGITISVYNNFFNREAAPEDIKWMTPTTAKLIYLSRYWAPLNCGDIQDLAFACAIFDSGVLYGVGTTAIIIQRALILCGASIKLDGILGDKSIAILNQFLGGDAASDARALLMKSIRDLLLERIDAIIAINPKDERYRVGWTRRADRLFQLLDGEFLNKFNKEMF